MHKHAITAIIAIALGLMIEAYMLGDPHPFAWGHNGIGTNEVADKCSDDGKSWWPARQSPDGAWACFAVDKPGGIWPFNYTHIIRRERVSAGPMGFGEAAGK